MAPAIRYSPPSKSESASWLDPASSQGPPGPLAKNFPRGAAQTRPPLTTVDMNLRTLGREAGRLVLAMSEGREVQSGIRKLPCSLVIRQSCRGGEAPA